MKQSSELKRRLAVGWGLAVATLLAAVAGCEKGLQKTTPLPGWRSSDGESVRHEASRSSFPNPIDPIQEQRARLTYASQVRNEEVWFISRNSGEDSSDDTPGSGTLAAQLNRKQKPIPLPLRHTDVHARVDGYISTVTVTQQ